MSVFEQVQDRLLRGFGFSDIEWRDQMIRELREALKFYADEKNYQQRGWQGDPDKSPVDSDNGKIARAALEKK
jgi:hypothetical protein